MAADALKRSLKSGVHVKVHVLLAAHQTRVQLEGEPQHVAACVNAILYRAKLQSSKRGLSADSLIVRHCAMHIDIL